MGIPAAGFPEKCCLINFLSNIHGKDLYSHLYQQLGEVVKVLD